MNRFKEHWYFQPDRIHFQFSRRSFPKFFGNFSLYAGFNKSRNLTLVIKWKKVMNSGAKLAVNKF